MRRSSLDHAPAASAEASEVISQLLQANARIEAQAQALRECSAEFGRMRERAERAEHSCELLQYRCSTLEAELRIALQARDEARNMVTSRDAAWSQQRSLEGAMEATTMQAQAVEAHAAISLETCQAALVCSQGEAAARAADVTEAREHAKAMRSKLTQAEERNHALDTLAASRLFEIDGLKKQVEELHARAHVWRKERAKILRELDRNTSSSILRREELYFTRTNLLKEQLRLKGELEHNPLPLPHGPPSPHGTAHGTARGTAHGTPHGPPSPTPPTRAPSGQPVSPRGSRSTSAAGSPRSGSRATAPAPAAAPTFVYGLSPRAPRSLDDEETFGEQLLLEFRAASRAAKVSGMRPSSPPFSPTKLLAQDEQRVGARVADKVGVPPST